MKGIKLMNILSKLIALIGIDALLPIIEETAIDRLATEDREFVARTVELPESVIDAVVAKTKADKAAVMAARAKLGEAWADFVISFRPVDG